MMTNMEKVEVQTNFRRRRLNAVVEGVAPKHMRYIPDTQNTQNNDNDNDGDRMRGDDHDHEGDDGDDRGWG